MNRQSDRDFNELQAIREDRSRNGVRRNRFFDPPDDSGGGDDRERGGRVYAAIEVPEPIDGQGRDAEPETVALECVDSLWLGSASERGLGWTQAWAEAPLLVLEVFDGSLPPFPNGAQPGDIAWFEVGYKSTGEAESNARAYSSLFGGGSPVRISYYEPRGLSADAGTPSAAIDWLGKPFKGEAAASLNDIRDALKNVDCSGGVAIYDIGQGNCHAALDSKLHIPRLYVDFGGGVLSNQNTFPKGFAGFCFTAFPMIVLSHWDWDHWSSAYRQERALGVPWITPPVPELPIQQAFAADLRARGSLHVWNPKWPRRLRGGAVTIECCTGRTSNDSGLAVTLHEAKGSRRRCLLPGDAAYRFIPSVQAGVSFDALSMTHHGGRLHSSDYPKAKRTSAAALSAGPRNSYSHPMFDTVAAHLRYGWPMPTPTAFSGQRPCHVLLPWGSQPHVFKGGCHADRCGVAIAEIFPPCKEVKRTAKPMSRPRIALKVGAKVPPTAILKAAATP
jgi:hypothetical protein